MALGVMIPFLGGNGNDYLNGGANNDQLIGGSGNDRIYGEFGNDLFIYNTGVVFNTSTVGSDLLPDFKASSSFGNDKIVLDKTTFAALVSTPGTGFSVAGEFAILTSNAAAETSSAYIVYNSSNGNLFYNQNGTVAGLGNGAQFADLPVLIAPTDFIIQA